MITTLNALKFDFSEDYRSNLNALITHINQCEEGSIIVAPEVVFTGFDYANLEKASEFSIEAINEVLLHVNNKIVIFTTIEKKVDGFYNFAQILHKNKVVYKQAKAKLFTFAREHDYFIEGNSKEISIVEVAGIKIAILICFELRFKELWKQVEGADVIAVPAFWGKNRAKHYVTLTNALAIVNQCYVIASDAVSESTGGECGIITPFGHEFRNENRAIVSHPYQVKEIQKMRRYMNVGI